METWQNPLTPILWLSTGLVLLLILLLFIFAYVSNHRKRVREQKLINHKLQLNHQDELLRNSLDIQEQERTRIATELHDELIAQLVRMKLMNSDETLNTLLAESIEKTRKLSHDLTPPLLDQVSIPEMLVDFLKPLEKQYAVDFTFRIVEERNLSSETKLQVFRIFQEVVTNIVKHAKATALTVMWRTSQKGIGMLVRDNGIGFDPGKKTGLGLKNIELRVQVIKGTYRFQPNASSGSSFLLILENQ